MKNTIFIDGSYGTVGLTLKNLIDRHPYLEILETPASQHKDKVFKQKAIAAADVVITCLPNNHTERSVLLVPETQKLIDCSTRYRCDNKWVYGLPELNQHQRESIRSTNRVSNPGCFATAFIIAIKPLIDHHIVNSTDPVSAFGITGYSAGGKRMIEHQEQAGPAITLHGLNRAHKHLAEMQRMTSLALPPQFIPCVGQHREGILMTIPFNSELSREQLLDIYYLQYENEPFVNTHATDTPSLSVHPANNNVIQLYLGGTNNQFTITASLNNLIKGAAGNALQCINLMLGLDECSGLT